MAQRCLCSFDGDSNPDPRDLNDVMDKVTVLIIRHLFELVVRHVGPVVTTADEPHYDCTEKQNNIVGELEAIVKLHGRHAHVSECFRSALPKAMYWLGTALLTNHTVGTLWKACVCGEDVEGICGTISDEAFAASVRFMYTRYLAGQAVEATSVQDKVWLGRDVPHHVDASDLVALLVRILRGSPGACITGETITSIDLDSKRNLRNLADVGVGKLERDAHGQLFLRKFDRSALTQRTLKWLQQNRIPGYCAHGCEAYARCRNSLAWYESVTHGECTRWELLKASGGQQSRTLVMCSQWCHRRN